MPETVQIEVRDERTLSVPCGVSAGTLARAVSSVPEDYKLASVEEITGGHQRDPYPVGMKLVFRRG